VAIENTATVHNVVVCTLCSCYPWPVLGLPPTWYKSAAYRSRMVREPRVLLREMGVDLPERVEVRVWDSSAEIRYLVLPARAARGTRGAHRGRARHARDARRDDRDGARVSDDRVTVGPEVARMTGTAALPRRNGELVFEALWQGRALGMALGVVRRLRLPWRE